MLSANISPALWGDILKTGGITTMDLIQRNKDASYLKFDKYVLC